MRYVISLILMFPAGVFASEKPPQAPPVERPAQAPPVESDYARFYREAKSAKRAAVFIGIPARKIAGVPTVSVSDYEGYSAQSIAVFHNPGPGMVLLRMLSPTATEAEIRGEARQVAVDPFPLAIPTGAADCPT